MTSKSDSGFQFFVVHNKSNLAQQRREHSRRRHHRHRRRRAPGHHLLHHRHRVLHPPLQQEALGRNSSCRCDRPSGHSAARHVHQHHGAACSHDQCRCSKGCPGGLSRRIPRLPRIPSPRIPSPGLSATGISGLPWIPTPGIPCLPSSGLPSPCSRRARPWYVRFKCLFAFLDFYRTAAYAAPTEPAPVAATNA